MDPVVAAFIAVGSTDDEAKGALRRLAQEQTCSPSIPAEPRHRDEGHPASIKDPTLLLHGDPLG